MKKLIVILIISFAFLGCDNNNTMVDRFGDNQVKILTDIETGNKYIVRHHIGGTYSILPLD